MSIYIVYPGTIFFFFLPQPTFSHSHCQMNKAVFSKEALVARATSLEDQGTRCTKTNMWSRPQPVRWQPGISKMWQPALWEVMQSNKSSQQFCLPVLERGWSQKRLLPILPVLQRENMESVGQKMSSDVHSSPTGWFPAKGTWINHAMKLNWILWALN